MASPVTYQNISGNPMHLSAVKKEYENTREKIKLFTKPVIGNVAIALISIGSYMADRRDVGNGAVVVGFLVNFLWTFGSLAINCVKSNYLPQEPSMELP